MTSNDSVFIMNHIEKDIHLDEETKEDAGCCDLNKPIGHTALKKYNS